MEELMANLAQYGPLGMWTASLLWMNHKQRVERKEDEERARDAMRYHQEQIAGSLVEQKHLLEKAIEKIDAGLGDMRAKYAEDRMRVRRGLQD